MMGFMVAGAFVGYRLHLRGVMQVGGWRARSWGMSVHGREESGVLVGGWGSRTPSSEAGQPRSLPCRHGCWGGGQAGSAGRQPDAL